MAAFIIAVAGICAGQTLQRIGPMPSLQEAIYPAPAVEERTRLEVLHAERGNVPAPSDSTRRTLLDGTQASVW